MVMRIGGLASGMDTEQMVTDLMRVERMKIDRFFRQEEALKWQREALNTTNKTLADFILKARSDFGLTRTSSTGTIMRSSTQNFDWVKQVSSSDESAIKATASATAMEGTYKIKVKQLADVASVMSGDLKGVLTGNRFDVADVGESFNITTATGSAEIKLKNAEVTGQEISNFDFSGDNKLTLYINNKIVSLEENFGEDLGEYPTAMAKLVNHIQDKLGDTDITVGNDENKLTFHSKNDIAIGSSDVGSDDKLKLETMLGLENKLYKASNSIDDVVKQINNAADEDGKSLGLRAAYDSSLGRLMITSKEQGADQVIKIDKNELTEKIFGGGGQGDEPKIFTAEGQTGKNAIVDFNGQIVDDLKSNNVSIFGMNLQLQAADKTKEITLKVETNIDGIYNKVKDFVEEYNELIDKLDGLLKEKSHRDFQPLTNEEREAMKEKEIEMWEEKAKSGLLRNDETISRMLQNMRNSLYAKVEGLEGFNHITQIGITTGNYQSGGKLEINEEKLKQAIIDDADGVINLLFKTPDSNDTGDKRANTGLVERVFDDMIVGMKDIVRRAGTGEDASTFRKVQSNMLIDFVTSGSISVMDRDIMNIGKRIATEEMNLAKREERYWSQFVAMEKALEKMNQQSGWLMAQLGQMGGW